MFAVFFSSAAAQNQNDLKRSHEFYEKALQEKKTAARLELLQKAAQWCEASEPSALSPAARRQFAAIHFALGREYFQQTKWPAAIAHLEKAVAGDPAFFAAHATLGLIYFQQKKYAAAVAAYNQVLPAQPSAQLYNNLGAAQEAQGDLTAAIAAYQRALELEANLLQARKNLQRAQEKLALNKPIETKIAAIDSALLAAARRDSLLAVAAKTVFTLPKNKTPKNLKTDHGKKTEPQTTLVAEKNKKAAPAPKSKPARAVTISPAPSPIGPKVTLAPDINSIAKGPAVANKNSSPLPPPTRTVATTPSSGHSGFAYVCGASVLLFGFIIFTQRRRLNRMWLHFKPALAAPAPVLTPEERLLPAAVAPRLLERKNVAAPSSSTAFNNGRAIAAAAESDSAVAAESEETRQPSLQTQAFFAEMIAAEPELENFEFDLPENMAETGAAPSPQNGHVDAAGLVQHESVETVQALTSSPIVISAVELNGETGHEVLPPLHTETLAGNELSAINGQLPVISDQLSVTSYKQQETGNPLPMLGRYQIEREIGKGAMGKIYLARDPKLDRRVVIKTVCFNLAASDADTATLKDRVYREARAIAKLSHPNIVIVYDVEDNCELSYIVMEHIEGRDLRQALKAERRFEVERAVPIIAQVCSALDYAHQAGIFHRDIKPSNIMLLPNDKAKVTDFGIAKIADNFSLTLPGQVLGTPSYMAPEQFEEETADSRADIFSLGVVLYELLIGTRPFTGDSLAALAYKIVHKMHIPPSLQNVELPLELDDIIGRVLAKQPDERYQTAQEFREALLAVKFPSAV